MMFVRQIAGVIALLSILTMSTAASDASENAFGALDKELGSGLVCSSCAFSAESLRYLLGAKARKKRMSKASKRKAVDAAIAEACEASRFPKQIAELGDEGDRRFEDFQSVMKKGGSVSNLNMSPENLDKIQRVCRKVFELVADDVREKALAYKERLGGYNWERWLCVKSLHLCEQTQFHQSDEEDEEEAEVELDEDDL
mmetsp:Transcript_28608/g.52035  ORF Transcript_28608/g.52035 Transcript_28608/m.52035 type:complete len:199 (+) Transcript_28608:78-674(+)